MGGGEGKKEGRVGGPTSGGGGRRSDLGWGSAMWPGRLPWKTAIGITWKILTSPINAVHAVAKTSIKEKTETTVGNEMIVTM